MTPEPARTGQELLEAVFSDDPAPEIQAAVIVSHTGDECIGASWLLSRLYDRASVFRLTSQGQSASPDSVTLTGLPGDRCHNLGLVPGSLASDLEALSWLVCAAVQDLKPRLLVTHACDGMNLDHDAVAFAVHMTALLLPRFGAAAPVVLEFPCRHAGAFTAAPWEKGVRVDFGPDSSRLKEQILRSHLVDGDTINRESLRGEVYRPSPGPFAFQPPDPGRRYSDAQRTVGDFWAQASQVALGFAREGLIAGPTA